MILNGVPSSAAASGTFILGAFPTPLKNDIQRSKKVNKKTTVIERAYLRWVHSVMQEFFNAVNTNMIYMNSNFPLHLLITQRKTFQINALHHAANNHMVYVAGAFAKFHILNYPTP